MRGVLGVFATLTMAASVLGACIRTDWTQPKQESVPNTLTISEEAFFLTVADAGDGADGSARLVCKPAIVAVELDASCSRCGPIVISRDGVELVRLSDATSPPVHLLADWVAPRWVTADAGDEGSRRATFAMGPTGGRLAATSRCAVRFSTSEGGASSDVLEIPKATCGASRTARLLCS